MLGAWGPRSHYVVSLWWCGPFDHFGATVPPISGWPFCFTACHYVNIFTSLYCCVTICHYILYLTLKNVYVSRRQSFRSIVRINSACRLINCVISFFRVTFYGKWMRLITEIFSAKNATLWGVQPYKLNWQFYVHCTRIPVSNVHGKPWTKQKLYFSERHLSSVCLTCSYVIDLLQLQVCRCKASDVTYRNYNDYIYSCKFVRHICCLHLCRTWSVVYKGRT